MRMIEFLKKYKTKFTKVMQAISFMIKRFCFTMRLMIILEKMLMHLLKKNKHSVTFVIIYVQFRSSKK